MKFEDMQSLPEEDQKELFKRLDSVRAIGKSASYSLQYGAGVKTVARACKVSERVAKKLHEGYNNLNWSVPKIASMMITKKTSFGTFQVNPVNKLWYSLRSDKDKFSTLVQGTAAYVFDIWLYQCYILAKKRDIEWCLLAQQHDDQAVELDEGMQEQTEALVRDALVKVNKSLKLNVEIKCDVVFGYNGAEIH
jgi:DNA polymerase I-like protein with 3'-5' exonuclease and polymerase domains